jgi:peptidoglycan/LPS O-acetylase OafA/YrhL
LHKGGAGNGRLRTISSNRPASPALCGLALFVDRLSISLLGSMETSQLVANQTAPISLRQNLEKKNIPSLDGLRGISALSVALAHAWGLARWIPADYAVVLFFEISGLLITWLLLNEQDRSGTVDRLSFMKRRTLRLFPAFYACWMLCWLVPGVPGRWWSFFYMMDFYNAIYAVKGTPIDVMGMAWSLGIEEKYYLIWPSILKRFSRRSLLKAMLVLFGLVQVYHVIIYKLGHVMWAAWGFDTRIDAIILGSSLAIAIKLGWLPSRLFFHPLTVWGSVVLITLLSGVAWVHRLSYGVLIAAYPLAILLMAAIARPPRILNNRVASFFGRISYSLYLFNPLVVYFLGKLSRLQGFWQVVITMLSAILAATMSYYFIERPFLRIKDRFHRTSPPRPAAQVAAI